ncbi:MAG: hypothetical protein VX766_10270 [Pseudomonadota bacterium]|nr:hypothetical protein [Pseudomonadota bacterium]
MSSRQLRAIAGTVLVALALAATFTPALHDQGGARIDAMFTRALATFAAARALNGAISVVQGTEVALQPAGVGVTLTVGQALDPLNDLVERFSWVMLAATAALGTQSVLLEATAAAALTWFLGAVALATVIRIWSPTLARIDATGLLPRLLILLLFVRLALPLAALGADLFSAGWLEPRRMAAVAALETTRAELDAVEAETSAEVPAESDGVLEGIRRYLGTQSARLDPTARLQALVERLDASAERVVDLVVVFTLETIVVPLGTLWLLWRLTRIVQAPFVPFDGRAPTPGRRRD